MRITALALSLAGLCISLPVIWRVVHADESPNTSCGPNRGHDCHCPRMVQRRREHDTEMCMAIMDKAEHDACMASIPTLCQMVAHPQSDPETGAMDPDTCFKYCKFQALCFCNDTRCDVNGDPLPMELPDKFKNLPHAPKKGR